MKILGISGSASENSGNYFLLKAIADFLKEKHEMEVYQGLYELELFTPLKIKNGAPKNVQTIKKKIEAADLIIFSTPEYTHNIPAVLKSLIEWCTHSGEFAEKKVLPITFTPNSPRGEHAMQSLLSSLKTMKSKVLTSLPLFRTDVKVEDENIELTEEIKEMLKAILEMA